MMPEPAAPERATATEPHDGRTWHVYEVGTVDLGDGSTVVTVRVAEIVWKHQLDRYTAETWQTTSRPFVDVRRVTDDRRYADVGALTPQAATELAGLLAEAARLAQHFAGGGRC